MQWNFEGAKNGRKSAAKGQRQSSGNRAEDDGNWEQQQVMRTSMD